MRWLCVALLVFGCSPLVAQTPCPMCQKPIVPSRAVYAVFIAGGQTHRLTFRCIRCALLPLSAGIPNGRCCVSAVRRRGDGSLSASTSIVGRRTPLPPVCCWHPKKVANALTAILSSPTLKPPTVSCGRIGHWHQPLCFPSVKRRKVNRGRLVMCHEVGRHHRRN
jgi:hypothetical protein